MNTNNTVYNVSTTRDEAMTLIESNGGTFRSGVSSKTDILVVGSSPGATKMRLSDVHKVKRLYVSEFITLLEKWVKERV